MLLVIDSGNTNVVFGLYKDKKKISQWRLKNEPQRPADEYIAFLNQWLSLVGYSLDSVEDVIISSVVPEVLFNLKWMVKRYFNKKPFVIGEPSVNLKMVIKLDKPENLGADLLVNAYGGYKRYGGPLVIVDFGTATTLEVIDGKGRYLGGAIAPGVKLSLKALHEAAAKLPPIAFARTSQLIGTTTVDAMQAGTYWGYVGMIEKLVKRTCQEYIQSHGPSEIKIVTTGGLSSIFFQDLSFTHFVNENLTLDSLAGIYVDVCKKKE
ncbi:MAG: type III pantothenate kinase [Alphaproteobacteria bacterium]|nr:type III pantothenate kinase [Alphaproteobacteria bacterium]